MYEFYRFEETMRSQYIFSGCRDYEWLAFASVGYIQMYNTPRFTHTNPVLLSSPAVHQDRSRKACTVGYSEVQK